MVNLSKAMLSGLVLIVLVACGTSPEAARHERAAEEAALQWLVHIDTGDYGQSWEAAGPAFRAALAKELWVTTAQVVQGPLGTPESRELIAAKYSDRPLAGQEGERVVLQYRTSYAAQGLIETLWMTRDRDRWVTDRYYLVPR